jgi:hypothetical protein
MGDAHAGEFGGMKAAYLYLRSPMLAIQSHAIGGAG